MKGNCRFPRQLVIPFSWVRFIKTVRAASQTKCDYPDLSSRIHSAEVGPSALLHINVDKIASANKNMKMNSGKIFGGCEAGISSNSGGTRIAAAQQSPLAISNFFFSDFFIALTPFAIGLVGQSCAMLDFYRQFN